MTDINESKSVTIHLPDDNEFDYQEGSAFYKTSNVRSPPPRELELLNNTLSGSQNNICNGSVTTTINGSGLKKVPNASPNNQKRPMISLTHLPKRPPVDIEFLDLSYSVSEGRKKGMKKILQAVNGKFRSGELTAIMGPSGAGKSTLMNILAGYKVSNLEGSILINAKDRNLRRFRKMSCYIMQDDCLTPNLSVKEALRVSANLKIGNDLTGPQKEAVIEEVIEVLNLSDCGDTLTCSISGGQRKRLSIALELVNNPPVMFFDEPTSGLDSSSCFQCISLLKSLARGGRTIICTIHQPSARIFEMFDYLYMLTEGNCIYKGVVMGLVPFLSSVGLHCPSYHNPADYVLEVACGEHGDYLQKLITAVNTGKCNSYDQKTPETNIIATTTITNDIAKETTPLKSATSKQTLPLPNGINKPTPMNSSATCTTALLDTGENLKMSDNIARFPISGSLQFWILLKRTAFTTLRDTQLTTMRLAAYFVIGCLLGLIYYDIGNDASKVMSNAGLIFFTIMFITFSAMMPTILTFPLEMSVFIREHLNYWYSIKAYYFAKTVADIPFQLLLTICYMMSVYYITSQPMEPMRFCMVLLIAVLTALVSQSLGLLVGAAFNVEGGVFIGPIASIPMVLLSGFFVNLNDIPVYLRWLPYGSYMKYSFEGIMIAIYGLNRPKMQCSQILCVFKSPKRFLDELSLKDDLNTYLMDVGVLTGIFIFIRFCLFFVLSQRDLKKFRQMNWLTIQYSKMLLPQIGTILNASDVKVQIIPCQPKTLTHLPQRPKVNLGFTDLTYTVQQNKSSKVILKSVSGHIRSGELTAIMGPSGAGKSTLLNILTGYKTTGLQGSITMNGNERNMSQFRKLSAYIMQDNQLHANLTVDEAMAVAAKLKIGSKTSKEKEEIINEILDTLGLLDHRKTMTSRLSGGQKKRLSIALELVSNPPVMFFDEPTSGLDSSSCFQCISLLKTLASGGRTIICTIHQPSARLFEMFDQLYTLADGQCVYQGSIKQLVPFLATLSLQCPSYHNPASYIIEVACGEYGDNTQKLVNAIDNGRNDIRDGKPFPSYQPEILNNSVHNTDNQNMSNFSKNIYDVGFENVEKHLAKNKFLEEDSNLQHAVNNITKGTFEVLSLPTDNEKVVNVETKLLDSELAVPQPRYGNTELSQFFIILARTLLFSRRDWTLMYLRLFAHILVGILIGGLYYDIGNDGAKVLSNLGFLFFNMLFLMYTAMTITILSFPLEMPVLLKENFNRWYSLRSYYLAITFSDIPFQTIFCVIYVGIVYFMTGQPLEFHRFGMFLAACLLVAFVAQSVGLVVGAAMNVQNGVFLAPVMSVPFLLFSGFFVSFDAIPIYLRWITYLSYIRYGFEGTALATYSFDRPKLKCSIDHCHFKIPTTTLEELDMIDSDYRIDIAALLAIFFVLRVAAYLFLRWKLNTNR
ncbi:hypothetical protein FQR65_LT04917 [Abscondita terminalis]|nr:hypothetical protein FQR65_LT04917 [Abscondita terminalis]